MNECMPHVMRFLEYQPLEFWDNKHIGNLPTAAHTLWVYFGLHALQAKLSCTVSNTARVAKAKPRKLT